MNCNCRVEEAKDVDFKLFNKGNKHFHQARVISSCFKMGGISASIFAVVSFMHVGSVSPLILLLISALSLLDFCVTIMAHKPLLKLE